MHSTDTLLAADTMSLTQNNQVSLMHLSMHHCKPAVRKAQAVTLTTSFKMLCSTYLFHKDDMQL